MKLTFHDPAATIVFDRENPVFELECRTSAGDPVRIFPSDLEEETATPGVQRARFRGVREDWGGEIRVEVVFEEQGPEVAGRIVVDNGSRLEIRRARFPNVTSAPVYPRDRLLFSTPWGDDIEGPVRHIHERRDGEMEYAYPSELAMQYAVLYNPGRSLYLAGYSAADETWGLNARVVHGNRLRLACVWQPFLGRGRWESPPTGCAVLGGSWHPAADLYRKRMAGVFPPPRRPAWMSEAFHGWVQVGMKFEGRDPVYRFRDLPGVYRRAHEATGLTVMHVFGWAGRGHDTLYPDYDANPELGTEDDLRSAMDAIGALGGRAILYTNARLIDPDSRFAREHGGDAARCLREDGGVYEEFYGTSSKTCVACPGAPAYREYLVGQVEKIITRYGAHAVQLDQVSCNKALPCFSRDHDHETPSTNFLPGYDTLLRDLRRRHTELDPAFFTWAEGVHERFGGLYDVNQGHGEDFTWQAGRSVPEQFAYTHPGAIITGTCLTPWHLCWVHGQGKPFDFHLAWMDDPAFARLVRSLLAVRKQYAEYFLRGVFRDSLGLSVVGDGVRAWRIDRGDGQGSLVNLWIPGNEPGDAAAATLTDLDSGRKVRPVYPDRVKVSREHGWVRVSWDGPLATLIWED